MIHNAQIQPRDHASYCGGVSIGIKVSLNEVFPPDSERSKCTSAEDGRIMSL